MPCHSARPLAYGAGGQRGTMRYKVVNRNVRLVSSAMRRTRSRSRSRRFSMRHREGWRLHSFSATRGEQRDQPRVHLGDRRLTPLLRQPELRRCHRARRDWRPVARRIGYTARHRDNPGR